MSINSVGYICTIYGDSTRPIQTRRYEYSTDKHCAVSEQNTEASIHSDSNCANWRVVSKSHQIQWVARVQLKLSAQREHSRRQRTGSSVELVNWYDVFDAEAAGASIIFFSCARIRYSESDPAGPADPAELDVLKQNSMPVEKG